MIILTAEQADQIRGPTSPGNALDPVALIDGSYVLPEAVIDDPAHHARHAYLQLLPCREVGSEEYPPPE